MVKAVVKFAAIGLVWFGIMSLPLSGRPIFFHVSEFMGENEQINAVYDSIKSKTDQLVDLATLQFAQYRPKPRSS